MSGWAAFWIFLAVFLLVDIAIFAGGYDGFFYQYKTDNELEAQRVKLGLPPKVKCE